MTAVHTLIFAVGINRYHSILKSKVAALVMINHIVAGDAENMRASAPLDLVPATMRLSRVRTWHASPAGLV